jgi:cyclophilin family peptidyl-prolyl cis-trans isomerase
VRRLLPVLLLPFLLFTACTSLLLDPHDPRLNARAPEVFRVRFVTTQGDFIVEIHRDWAPIGADRFYNLAAHHFFDGQRFFRVRAGFIAQFGVPGDPRIAQAWRNAMLPDDPPRQPNVRGTIAYAFTTANTRATQLYINMVDSRQLDSQGFAPIGTVVSGMDIVDRFYSGYGETSGGGMRLGHQDQLFAEGNAWLVRQFPRLDWIRSARVE